MKALWKNFAERVDALTLRERALSFGALACVLMTFLYLFLIDAEFARSKRLSAEIAQRQGEMKSLQDQVSKMGRLRQSDPDRANRERLAALNAELAELEKKVGAEERKFTAPDRMRNVVQELVARNRRVQLVDLKTLPVTSIAEQKAANGSANGAAAAPAAKPPAETAGRMIFRHGMELTVTGSYLDILAYLADLERLPTQLYWGTLDVNGTAYPTVTLKLTVFTLSLDKAWMSV